MKQIIAIIICVAVMRPVYTQVLVNIQLPAAGLTVKSQLWNLSLVNTSGQDINVQIEMTMTDLSNNQRALTGTSRIFILPKGVKQVRLSDVMPIAYTAGVGYNVDPNPDGFLPIGVFNICYTTIKYVNDVSELLGEDCQTIEVEPISPPLLIMPPDSEYVDVGRPFFSWLPPSPFNLFNNLMYDWVLVEVQNTQSGADAIQQNIPVLTQQNILITSLQYPLGSPGLDSNKLYAWRVTAKNNNSAIASSETWTFRVKKLGLDTDTTKYTGFYAKLSRQEDGSFISCTGILRYMYRNELNDNNIKVNISDISNNTHKPLPLDSTEYIVKYGQNFMQLDLRETNLSDRHVYLLELVNAKAERWYLKFAYRKPVEGEIYKGQ